MIMRIATSKYRNNIFRITSIVLFITIIFSGTDIFPSGKSEYSFWNLNYMNGFIGLESNYYYQNTILKTGFNEVQNSSQFNGSLSFDTKSNILHPNFLEIELSALFRPGTRNDNFMVAPDQADITTAERIAFKTNLFNQRPMNGSFYYNYDHSFVRRDIATNIENFRKTLGASVNFRNPIVNFNFNYNYDNWLLDELELNRFYGSIRHNFRAQANQMYGKNFTNKLTLNYTNFLQMNSINSLLIGNKIFDANLNTRVLLDVPIPINYSSLILYNNQYGYDRRNKFQILQRVSSNLPSNLRFNGNYNYNYFKINSISSTTNSINFGLDHRLFQSLRSHINFRFSDFNQTMYSEKTDDFKVGFNYTKDISIGNLNLAYSYGRFGRTTESLSNVLSIFNEPHQLTDGTIELLYNPDVFTNTIVVTDENSIIIYQENFDYEIIAHGDFTEIRRIMGGQIPNGGRILVNYDNLRDNSFKYNSNNHKFFAGINFFNNFIEVSYSGNEVTFDNLENIRYVVLKLISQRVMALSFNFWRFSTGIEIDIFKSNIVPYESQRYFVKYDNKISNSVLFSLAANYRNTYLNASRQRQTFADGVGRVMFFLSMESKLMFEGSYRLQRGYGLDLELLKFKTEYQMNYRAVQISVGLELFDRTFIQETRQFFNGYIALQRNF